MFPKRENERTNGHNNANNYMLHDFYNQAVFYSCSCGWDKIFEHIFKPVGNLLNISNLYGRLNFRICGWSICSGNQKGTYKLTFCFLPDSAESHFHRTVGLQEKKMVGEKTTARDKEKNVHGSWKQSSIPPATKKKIKSVC